ncbi:MAG: PD40 domain-containing protein [Cytophagaceae bacterium]|nr:PD40 domain-containing protein [Cytophagaceae bacterium]
MNTSKFLFFLMFLSFFELSAQDKKRLPNPINTPASIEYAPSITADGQTLIYQSDQYGFVCQFSKKSTPNQR